MFFLVHEAAGSAYPLFRSFPVVWSRQWGEPVGLQAESEGGGERVARRFPAI